VKDYQIKNVKEEKLYLEFVNVLLAYNYIMEYVKVKRNVNLMSRK
jgi:hypothetical protein